MRIPTGKPLAGTRNGLEAVNSEIQRERKRVVYIRYVPRSAFRQFKTGWKNAITGTGRNEIGPGGETMTRDERAMLRRCEFMRIGSTGVLLDDQPKRRRL